MYTLLLLRTVTFNHNAGFYSTLIGPDGLIVKLGFIYLFFSHFVGVLLSHIYFSRSLYKLPHFGAHMYTLHWYIDAELRIDIDKGVDDNKEQIRSWK